MSEIKATVLVVDDEPNIARGIQVIFEKEGYRVITASSGTEALLKVKEENPSLVMLDILMPGLSGIETLRCIKALNKDIPVVMVTAVKSDEESKAAMEAGAYDYVIKPIDFKYLKQSVLVKLFLENR